jgi:WD40 repeat protein
VFSPDGRTVLSAGNHDQTVKLWDVATGKELRSFTGHVGPVHAVAMSPDGRTALSGAYDRVLKLWDLTGL